MSPLIASHAAVATVALLLGAYVLLRRRKGDLLHRRAGVVWAVAMYATVISSFWIRELRDGGLSWIHGISLFTFCTLTAAVWAALTARPRLHRAFVIGSYWGVLGAFVGAVAVPSRDVPQLAVHAPEQLAAGIAACALTVWGVVRVAGRRPRRVPTSSRRREAAAASAPATP